MIFTRCVEAALSAATVPQRPVSPAYTLQVFARAQTDRGMLRGARLSSRLINSTFSCKSLKGRFIVASQPMAPSTPTEVRSSESPSATSAVHARTTKKDQLKLAREDVKKLLSERSCHPIIVRLAWHDSGTYDKV